MQRTASPTVRAALPIALLLLTVPLAGCAAFDGGGDDGGDGAELPDDAPYASFEEALSAPGEVLKPVNSTSTVRLKLLQPASTQDLDQGVLEIWVLLYDSATSEPITDATFSIGAFMPAMGHGTNPEVAPVHQGAGFYKGSTNLMMGGGWIINLDVELADGTSLEYDLSATVAGGGMHMPPDPRSFDSFQDALDADGILYDPANADNLTRMEAFSASDVTDVMYSNSHTFTVDSEYAVEVQMEVTLTPGPTGMVSDELTFALTDPGGQQVGTLTVSGGTPSGSLTSDAPATGEWTIDVSGHAVSAAYDVNVSITHTLTLKLLDPSNPLDVPAGERPFVVLLFDQADEVAENNATVSIASSMPAMGHNATDETQPEFTGNGTYTGFTNHAMEGEWVVDVTVEASDGKTYLYNITYQVSGGDGMSMGG